MKAHPILFSPAMVRANLAGLKTETRRVVKPQSEERLWPIWERFPEQRGITRWEVGDRLWVKENHYLTDDGDYERVVYAADEDAVAKHLASLDLLGPQFPVNVLEKHKRLRPSIHMPRWASRMTLTVKSVRVERVQSITDEDAIAEGIGAMGQGGFGIYGNKTIWEATAVRAYGALWATLHKDDGPNGWHANPWVSITRYTVEKRNIDAATSLDTLTDQVVRDMFGEDGT